MTIITQRQLIQNIAKRWRYHHHRLLTVEDENSGFEKLLHRELNSLTMQPHRQKLQRIADNLDKLDGDTATAAEVDAIVGNKLWTTIPCDECKQRVPVALMVGEKPAYESNTAHLCLSCLEKAVATIPEMQTSA